MEVIDIDNMSDDELLDVTEKYMESNDGDYASAPLNAVKKSINTLVYIANMEEAIPTFDMLFEPVGVSFEKDFLKGRSFPFDLDEGDYLTNGADCVCVAKLTPSDIKYNDESRKLEITTNIDHNPDDEENEYDWVRSITIFPGVITTERYNSQEIDLYIYPPFIPDVPAMCVRLGMKNGPDQG